MCTADILFTDGSLVFLGAGHTLTKVLGAKRELPADLAVVIDAPGSDSGGSPGF